MRALLTLTIGSLAAAFALSAATAQTNSPGAAQGKSHHRQAPLAAQRHGAQFASPTPPPLNSMGHGLADTIIRPPVDPVPFQPSFTAPPPVMHFGPQVPAISPSAPVFVSPPIQAIDPLTGQVIIIQR
jgi:hypothetical protein